MNVDAWPVAMGFLLIGILPVVFRRQLSGYSRKFEGDAPRENDRRNWLAVIAPVVGVAGAAFTLFFNF